MEGRTRLESWKEISTYLQRSVKTCQRWEIELGLPIHRLDGTPSARVFANPDELDAWMNEKLSHIRERPESLLTKRSPKEAFRSALRPKVLVMAATILVLVGSGVAWRLFLVKPPVFPEDAPNLAVLPFETPAGDAVLETWKTPLPSLISMDLVQSRTLSIWPTPNILRLLAGLKMSGVQKYSGEDLKKIGQRTRTRYLATGILSRSGKTIVLDLSLHDAATAGIVRSLKATCSGERDIFSMVDGLTRDIKRALGVPARLVSSDVDARAAKITTSSPEAFKIFCQGQQQMLQGMSSEAMRAYEGALAIDPDFAEARLMLYWEARNGDVPREALRLGQEILGSIDRLNIFSRYRFETDFYENVQRDLPKCMAALTQNWEIMRDQVSGHLLADYLYDLDEFDQAIPLYEKLYAINPKDPDYPGHLIYCYAAKGQFEKAEKTIDDYLAREPKPPAELFWSRSDLALEQKKYDVALGVLDRMYSLYPRAMYTVKFNKGVVYLTRDELDLAETELQRVANEGEREQRAFGFRSLMGVCLTRGRVADAMAHARSALDAAKDFGDAAYEREAHYYLAYLHQVSGNLLQALEEIELACQDYQQSGPWAIRPLQLKALVLLDLGRTDDFSSLIDEMTRYIEKEHYPKLMRACYYLMGRRELLQKHGAKAVEHLWKAVSLLPPTIAKKQFDSDGTQYWYALGEAYDLAGSCVSAEVSFLKVPPYWDERFASGDLYALSFYRAAKLQEQCGRHPMLTASEQTAKKSAAFANYRKFLGLWGDADPMFAAAVEDARKRVGALEAELATPGSGPGR